MGVGFAIAHAITRSSGDGSTKNLKPYSIFIWMNYPFKKGLKEYSWFTFIQQHLLIDEC